MFLANISKTKHKFDRKYIYIKILSKGFCSKKKEIVTNAHAQSDTTLKSGITPLLVVTVDDQYLLHLSYKPVSTNTEQRLVILPVFF